MSNDWKSRTKLVHGGIRRSQYNEVSEALFLTQGFVYDTAEQAEARFLEAGPDEFIYARYGNPTVAMFEDRIAGLEGAEDAFACASGMAAVQGALMALVKAGDHVVAARALFGSCLFILENILPKFGVEVTLVDGTDLDAWRAAVRPDTKLCFFESMSNPTLEIVDIKGVAEIAHAVGALVVSDNVFSTPIYSDAIAQGADIVTYSATKHIDGQGRVLGGVILGPKDLIRGPIEAFMKHTGGALSPFNAWVLLKGLETMDLRVRAQTATAQYLAEKLEGNPALSRVIYPGLASHPQHELAMRQLGAGGTVLSFDIKGGRSVSFDFLNRLEIAVISNNLGDAKTIATPPAFTTHQRLPDDQKETLGITPGLIRLSCGLEDRDDLLKDLETALAAALEAAE
ncbi:O-succinylhomoserine sulfhydrylase [Marinovum sp.]|uniref:O-succinylhomoserine sulfhydrylase n=1 Tax=Marinovum sp. TaxID=2024839 RepID=UPI003A8CBD63